MARLTWEQSKVVVGIQSGFYSFPVAMPACHRERYISLKQEILFNTSNGVNVSLNEALKNDAHRLIATYFCNNR